MLRIEPAQTVPVEIKHGQQHPEFPLVNPEKAGKAKKITLRLKVLDKKQKGIDPKKDEEFLIVLKLYDVGYLGTFGSIHFRIWGKGRHAYRPRTSVAGVASGSHWAREPLHRTRLLEKTYRLPKAFLNGSYGGYDLEITVDAYLFLQQVSVYRKDEALYDRHEAKLREITLEQFELIKRRSLVEDRSLQADRMVDYLAGFRSTPDPAMLAQKHLAARLRKQILAAFVALEVAVDDFYYQGRVAVARGDTARVDALGAAMGAHVKRLAALLDQLEAGVDKVTAHAYRAQRGLARQYWFAPLRTHVAPMPYHGRKANPYERVGIFDASGSGDHVLAFNRPFASMGVTFRHLWYCQGALREDGSFDKAETRDDIYQREFLDGTPVGPLTWRHFCIINGPLGTGGLPKWFVKKHEKTEDLWAWNGAGEVKGKVNAFNDKIIDYFYQYHKRTAETFRDTPGYNMALLAAEGMQFLARKGACENGYSPSAKRKFRAYLGKKHGSGAAMNKTLGTQYASFQAVEPPADMGLVLRRTAGPLDYDFERFRRTAMVNLFAQATRAFKEVNPELLVWFESMGRFDLTAPHGIDCYNTFKIADIASTHSQGDFNRIWNMSVHRYAKGSVYGKQENIPSESSAHCNPKTEWLRASNKSGFLIEMLCGNRCLGAWNCTFVNRRASEYYGPYLYDGRRDLQPFRAAGAVPLTRRRADMLLPILNAVRWRHPRIGMLYSTTTQLVGWPYQEMEHEAFPIHRWLYHSGLLYFVTHEDALTDRSESLADYHVIVAPLATHTRRELDTRYVQWVRNGGTLVSSGPFGVYDQHGKPDLTLLKEVFGDLTVTYQTDERGDKNALSPDSIAWLRNEVGDLVTTAQGGWFWKITLKEKRPDTRVLLALADGTPVLLEGTLGKGRVIFSACGLGQNGLAKVVLRQVRRRVVPFASVGEHAGFLSIPLVDATRHVYLGLVNTRYEAPLRDTVTIDAKVRRVVDLGIDHGFPVPVRHKGLKTLVTMELAPGDGTILDLGMEADMLYEVRPLGDLPVADTPPVHATAFDKALRAIESAKLAPEAKREAFALVSLGKRCYSRADYPRAKRYLDQGRAVRNVPAFVKLDGDDVHAVRAPKPVKLDGVLDEWAGARQYALKGSATSGGAFMCMWDPAAIYVAVVVRDATLKEHGELGTGVNWRWGFDGAAIRLNASDLAGRSASGMVGADLHDGYAVVNVAINGRKYSHPVLGVAPANVRFAAKRIKGGYVLEVAIPAREHMILPVAGASVGFDLQLCGATGTFCRYAKREGALTDGLRLGRLYFHQADR